MYYFGARYYDAGSSIWLGVDPLASKYPGISPYAYVANNPINAIDPDGRSCVGCGPNGENMTPPERNGMPSYIGGNASKSWPPESGSKGQVHSDNDGTFVHDGENWIEQKDGSIILPSVTVTNEKSGNSSIIGTIDNYGDKVDPFIGLSALTLGKAINKELDYHSFTLDEGFENSLKRVSPVKTPLGTMKATTAFKTASVLGKVGVGLNVISAANYGVEIYNGNTAKGLTGLGVMAATTALTIACPPCALAAIGISAGYSLYLDDKIFEEK